MNPADELRDLLHGRLAGVQPILVEEREVVPPYRQLLCHQQDMTSTLARFHGGAVALEVLDEEIKGEVYWREVILKVGGKAVEYGVIQMFLNEFPPEIRQQILEGGKPLGAILNDSGTTYSSRPVGFLTIDRASFPPDFFPSSDGKILFGRYNRLLGENHKVLARIIEILPSESP